MSTATDRARAEAVAQVFDYLHRSRIVLDDLEIGGANLKSSNIILRERARRVEKCWSLMARLGVAFAELVDAAPKPGRRQRGRTASAQVIENKGFSGVDLSLAKPLKTNDIPDNHPVENSRKGRWRHKRRLAPGVAGS
jgi:hypothetical protein